MKNFQYYLYFALATVNLLAGSERNKAHTTEPSTNQKLVRFKSDVEKKTGVKVIIVDESSTQLENGLTECKSDQILIALKPTLTEEKRQSSLAHELGHAWWCGKGVTNPHIHVIPGPSMQDAQIASTPLSSCYLDPLADEEAWKRRLNPSISFQDALSRMSETSPSWVSANSRAGGLLWNRYIALNLYCVERRKHSMSDDQLERPFLGEPEIVRVLHKLKSQLPRSSCFDKRTCYRETLKLRDAAELQQWIHMINPFTNAEE